jgi:hypothetical protein
MAHRYKYSDGDHFIAKNGKIGTIIRIATLDEFGADFYFEEKNYVVVFNEGDFNPIASYNFIISLSPTKYNYVMTEDDIEKIISINNKLNIIGG